MAVKFSRLIGAAVGLAVAGMVTAAEAVPYRLEYEGQNFVAPDSPYAEDMSISGWIIIPSALPVGASFFATQPASLTTLDVVDYSFTNGVETLKKSNSQYGFKFLTDDTGTLIGWRLDIDNFIRSCWNPPAELPSNNFCDGDLVTSGTTVLAGNTDGPGTWTIQPVPLPAALPLFATALGGLV